jgi:isocitrate dehydrogenase
MNPLTSPSLQFSENSLNKSPFGRVQPSYQKSAVLFGAVGSHQKISIQPGTHRHLIPDHVRIPYIEGDGIGPEIMALSQKLVDQAVQYTYGDKRSIEWVPMEAGEKAMAKGLAPLPDETIQTIKDHFYFVKGPLNTPTGGGIRSINVLMRKMFDLFACIRPVKVIPGVVTPMKQDRTNIVLFRENTEDVYSGVEFEKGSPEAAKLIAFLNREFNSGIREDSAIGIKPISEFASKRVIAKAIDYALEHNRPTVTMVHKGNIMKFTEGGFARWGKELAQEKYPDQVILYDDFKTQYGGDFKRLPPGKVVLQERLTDAKFQDVILNPQWDSVLVTMNLNGDYLSDAYAATVGGLGVAPGANIGEEYAMFESTHGSAPDIAGQNKANPTALLLTMGMMLDEMGWDKASVLLNQSVEKTLKDQKMTGDLARQIPGLQPLGTAEYGAAILKSMETLQSQQPTSQELGVA